MPSKHDPADCLADIIENAQRIERYLGSIDRDAFKDNRMMRDAVERCLERICEAAHRLGSRAAELMPKQAWNEIRGMGNWLRHAYDNISFDVVWHAVHDEVPGLAVDARRVLDLMERGRSATSA